MKGGDVDACGADFSVRRFVGGGDLVDARTAVSDGVASDFAEADFKMEGS